MKKIISDLHNRELHITAKDLEEEITSDIIIKNKCKIIAFANKLSALKEPRLKTHAKTLFEIIEGVN